MNKSDYSVDVRLSCLVDLPWWAKPVQRASDLPAKPDYDDCDHCCWVEEWNPIGAKQHYVAHWNGKKWNKVRYAYISREIRKARRMNK